MAKANERRRLFLGVPHIPREAPLLVIAMTRGKSKTLVTPHHTYYDDSGCNAEQSKTFLWAGYAAQYLAWKQIGVEWNAILDLAPRIEFWHQSKVRARNRTSDKKSPFRTYDAEVLKERELLLCKLLHKYRDGLWAFAIHITRRDHDRYVKNKIDNPAWTDAERAYINPRAVESEHWIALFEALKRSEIIHSKKPEDRMPVSFHCEGREGDPYQQSILEIWQRLRQRNPQDYGAIDFPPGKTREHPQLQVADMLAWHVNYRRTKKKCDPFWKYVKGRRFIEDTVKRKRLIWHVDFWSQALRG